MGSPPTGRVAIPGGYTFPPEIKAQACPTPGTPAIENMAENRDSSNPRSGATRRPDPVRLAWASAPDRHKRVVRMLAFVLRAAPDHVELWHGFAIVLVARLTPRERACMAYAALAALEPDTRQRVFDAAHWGHVE